MTSDTPDPAGVVVDVGIPTSGRATFLREAVASALGQTLTAIRVTVGENGPGVEAVAEALAPFAGDERLRHVVNGTDLGPTRNFTRVARGSAPYLALLHDDDVWEPEFLRRRVDFLDEHESCGFAFSGAVIIDADSVARDLWEVDLEPGVHSPEVFLPTIYTHNVVPIPSVVVRRSAYETVGGEFRDILFNDHELWLRLGSRFDVGFLPGFDCSYRVHRDQTTSTYRRRLGEHRIEFQHAIHQMVGDRIPMRLRRDAAASAHLHVAADALESGRSVAALAQLARAVGSSPTLLVRPPELRRAGLLAAATLAGPAGHALWNSRREVGRRRADAEAARRVVSLRARRPVSSSPAFTVVVPARDAEWSIEETIRSILMQSLQDFEIVVVDDGSTDRTAEVARAAGGERVRIERAEGVGVSAARNRGVAAARGRLVSFLDSDDLWLPSYLEEMANAFARDRGLGLAYTDAWVLDELAGAIRRQPMMARRRPDGDLPTDAEAVFSLLIEGNFVYTSATVPRTVLERVGGYEETLSRAEDYDLWLRIVEVGFPAAYLPGPLAVYRLRAGSLSTDRLAMLKGECAALRNLLERDALSPDHRSIVSTRIAELTERIGQLEAGPTRKSSLPRRVWTRLERVRREGPLYREPPPEIAGGFPDLAYPLRAVRRMSKRIA